MNVLRFAIALSGTNSSKFSTVLNHIIIGILFEDVEKEFSLSDIKKAIKTKYELNFSEEDLFSAINEDKKPFIITGTRTKPKYTLKENPIQKQININNRFDLDKLLDSFLLHLQDQNTTSFDKELFKAKLNELFYSLFNSNKEEILALLSGNNPKTMANTKSFSQKEKDLIISFFEWNNEEKDRLVYGIVKSAYDYCILNLKSDSSESIFHSKQFYLDTNVIFSLMGINGQDKEEATKDFISKCKEIKTDLYYTNFTLVECKNTLTSLIDSLEKMVKGQQYIKEENFNNLFGKSTQCFLYKMYLNWIKNNPSRMGDFNGFRVYIDQQLTKLCDSFLYKNAGKGINQEKDSVKNHIASLSVYKEHLGRRFTNNSIITDACNYEFIEQKRNPTSINIKGQESFFITLDTAFISWSAKENENIISLVVHPNTMYSVLLRFSSRTVNDYRAFSNFISLGLENDYSNRNLDEYKSELLIEINSLDETPDIKEQILYYSNVMLNKNINGKTGVPELTPTEIVTQGKESVFKDLDKKHEIDKRELTDKYEQQIASLKAEKDIAVAEAKEEGSDQILKQQALVKAEKKVKYNKLLRILTIVLITAGILTLVIFGIIQLTSEGVTSLSGWLQISIPIISLIAIIIKPIRSGIKKGMDHCLSKDIEKYKEKYYTKLKAKYKNN